MCGRFSQDTRTFSFLKALGFDAPEALQPRAQVFPGQPVLAVRLRPGGQERELAALGWGLIPSWAKDDKIARHTFNARSETLHEKPSFKRAFRERRCLVPADAFFEWGPGPGGKKQLHRLALESGEAFWIAGLWESWQAPDGGARETCTLITCPAGQSMAHLHERMPLIVGPGAGDPMAWLKADQGIENILKIHQTDSEKLELIIQAIE
jgi:putative SOS response-associated peptidase YedK